MTKQYYVYLLTNKTASTIYTGVTNDLIRRVYEHKHKCIDGFTKKYNLDRLAYYEVFQDIRYAISREKQIKAGSRQNKINLVVAMNPMWRDLYEDIVQ